MIAPDIFCDAYQPIPATSPTGALCGSAEKIEVMRARLERGESLWHPLDTTQLCEASKVHIYRAGIRECVVTTRELVESV